ncbi:hypothetical protein CEXT_101831 [Caerostris extrusa]|uniref:Uncharacterized protein n=1 Tax=Caerostris extrusa TaxID=172846 RepID=A0AAV4WRQ6_CAEEX|nr:hypothetical protein CEXT_101831 [Caerostris extrusa]
MLSHYITREVEIMNEKSCLSNPLDRRNCKTVCLNNPRVNSGALSGRHKGANPGTSAFPTSANLQPLSDMLITSGEPD